VTNNGLTVIYCETKQTLKTQQITILASCNV
jgi:hypothetical protein